MLSRYISGTTIELRGRKNETAIPKPVYRDRHGCCGGNALPQTMSYADAMQRLAGNCGTDIQRYCKGANLGGEQVKNCLIANQTKVSASCKTGWSFVFASLQKRATAQATILKICELDINRFCGGMQTGDGNILECVTMAIKRVSPGCRQTALDAGWL